MGWGVDGKGVAHWRAEDSLGRVDLSVTLSGLSRRGPCLAVEVDDLHSRKGTVHAAA